MRPASKELLRLEARCSTSSMESSLLICDKKTSALQKKQAHHDSEPMTGPVPKSQVLGKVQDFLAVMSEANKRLELEAKENPTDYDIEALNGNESEIIEMDLMLGIADLHTPEAVAAAESAVAGVQPNTPMFGSETDTESEDDTSDDSDDDEDDGHDKQVETSAKLEKPESIRDDSGGKVGKKHSEKQSKKRPRIVELS